MPGDFVEESRGVWRVRGSDRRVFGDHQCEVCGVPVDDGVCCNDCFHFLERRRRMRRAQRACERRKK